METWNSTEVSSRRALQKGGLAEASCTVRISQKAVLLGAWVWTWQQMYLGEQCPGKATEPWTWPMISENTVP